MVKVMEVIKCLFFISFIVRAWSFRLAAASIDEQCGVEASDNLLHRSPWAVYIEYWRRGELSGVRCAGTLVGSSHVLTAAHCLDGVRFERLKARLGEYDITTEMDSVDGVTNDKVVTIEVVETFMHPDYDGHNNDIAILKLKTAAPYNDFIRPICLPSTQFVGKVEFLSSGWGELITSRTYSHVKKLIPLPFWTPEECKTAYEHEDIPEKVICAGGEEGIDTCRGDSGGPLMLKRNRVELWGVTSMGKVHCGSKGSPGLYTNVAEFMSWIQETLKK